MHGCRKQENQLEILLFLEKQKKKTNQLERNEETKNKAKQKKSIGEQTRPIEIKGEGQRKLMVSSNNPNSDHQKWSHL